MLPVCSAAGEVRTPSSTSRVLLFERQLPFSLLASTRSLGRIARGAAGFRRRTRWALSAAMFGLPRSAAQPRARDAGAQACQARLARQMRHVLHVRQVYRMLQPRQACHVRGARSVCQVRPRT